MGAREGVEEGGGGGHAVGRCRRTRGRAEGGRGGAVQLLVIWETRTSPGRCQVSGARCQMSGVRCQVSGVRCRVSHLRMSLILWGVGVLELGVGEDQGQKVVVGVEELVMEGMATVEEKVE